LGAIEGSQFGQIVGEGHVEIGKEAQRFGFERFRPFEQIMAGTLLGAPARVGFRRQFRQLAMEGKAAPDPGISAVRGEVVLWTLCGLRCRRCRPCLVGTGLVWLSIAAQVLNAFLLPLVIGFLVALAVKAPPEPMRPRGLYLWILIGVSASVVALGLYGGISGLL
jgi:hypothetical protein